MTPRRLGQALLTDGPLQDRPVEVEAVEGRPPMTIDLPDEDGGTVRYCLSEYAFLYVI